MDKDSKGQRKLEDSVGELRKDTAERNVRQHTHVFRSIELLRRTKPVNVHQHTQVFGLTELFA